MATPTDKGTTDGKGDKGKQKYGVIHTETNEDGFEIRLFHWSDDDKAFLRQKFDRSLHQQLGLGTTDIVTWSSLQKGLLRSQISPRFWKLLGLNPSENDEKQWKKQTESPPNAAKKEPPQNSSSLFAAKSAAFGASMAERNPTSDSPGLEFAAAGTAASGSATSGSAAHGSAAGGSTAERNPTFGSPLTALAAGFSFFKGSGSAPPRSAGAGSHSPGSGLAAGLSPVRPFGTAFGTSSPERLSQLLHEKMQEAERRAQQQLKLKFAELNKQNKEIEDEIETKNNEQQAEIDRLTSKHVTIFVDYQSLAQASADNKKKIFELRPRVISLRKELENTGTPADIKRLEEELSNLEKQITKHERALESNTQHSNELKRDLENIQKDIKEATRKVERNELFGMTKFAMEGELMVDGKVVTRMRIFQVPRKGKGFHRWRLISRTRMYKTRRTTGAIKYRDDLYYVDPTRTIAIEGEDATRDVIKLMESDGITAKEAVFKLRNQGRSVNFKDVNHEWFFCDDLEYQYKNSGDDDEDKAGDSKPDTDRGDDDHNDGDEESDKRGDDGVDDDDHDDDHDNRGDDNSDGPDKDGDNDKSDGPTDN